jgi:hypothetical protein
MPVDRDAVLTRLRQQRIADHAAIVGVFLDCLRSEIVILCEFRANGGDAFGFGRCQLVEIALHPVARRLRVGFGQR